VRGRSTDVNAGASAPSKLLTDRFAVCDSVGTIHSGMIPNMHLPNGYSDVPDGKLASVVTCLQMLEKPELRSERSDSRWQLRRIVQPDTEWYREIFGRIGTDWLWYSRLVMPRDELEAILRSPDDEVYALTMGGRDEGLLELDFREAAQCELAFFGLTDALQGQGAGRWLMNRAIERAWARAIGRFWVHTCTLDHPGALAFYLRSGFRAYARRVEVADDPRLTGLAPRTAAAHIPIIEPRR
jgi:GNAT superfamily N-acetyltransferase